MSREPDPADVGLAASLVDAMVADGVELTDRAAVNAWIDAFNALPSGERVRVISGHGRRLTPMLLPDDDALATAALDAVATRQVVGFLSWVGDGQTLTPQRHLGLADGKRLVAVLETGDRFDHTVGGRVFPTKSTAELTGVDLIFRVAIESGLVRAHEGTLQVTERGRRFRELADHTDDPGEVLDAWRAIVVAMLNIGPTASGQEDRYGWSWLQGFVDQGVEEIPYALGISGNPLPVRNLMRAAFARFSAVHQMDRLPDLFRSMLPDLVTRTINSLADRLVWLGIASRDDAGTERDLWGDERQIGGQLGLTPLGNWYIRPRLIAGGYEVPVIGAYSDAPGHELLKAIADWPPEAFESEVQVWARGRADPAGELAAAARAADKPDGRQLAFVAFSALGEQSEAAVRGLLDAPALRPFASVWLVERGYEEPGFISPDDAPHGLVQLLASVLLGIGADALHETRPARDTGEGNVAMIEGLWRVDDPYTAPVLEALSNSPVRKVARAARRGLFKHQNLKRDHRNGRRT